MNAQLEEPETSPSIAFPTPTSANHRGPMEDTNWVRTRLDRPSFLSYGTHYAISTDLVLQSQAARVG